MADERSSIWDIAAWGSLAGGTAYGAMRSYPSMSQVVGAGNRDVAQETASRMRDIGRFNVGRMGSNLVPINDKSLSMVSGLSMTSSTSTVKADIASATYEALLSGGRVGHQGI